MARKSGLGRGLDALIISNESTNIREADQIRVDRIVPNPRQPRAHINSEELIELTASVKEHGIIQPVIVTYDQQGDSYTLIAGERRLLAARQAGLETIPAIVREASEQQRLVIALIENVQRTDLNAMEAAEAYRQLAEDFNLSHEEIAHHVGKSRVAITNTLRLLKLPKDIQQALVENKISEGHARALLTLPSPQAQSSAYKTILNRDLNVRQTEELVRKLTGQQVKTHSKPAQAPEISALEERLRTQLGTKVVVKSRKNGGTLTIHYYSDEELDSLIEMILGD
jgi:ParB family chromosome partitioning protein